jgi:hypothetical protein
LDGRNSKKYINIYIYYKEKWKAEHGGVYLYLIPALGRLREEDLEFEARLDYIPRPYLKITQN